MGSLIDKLKTQIEVWRVTKYTKRRSYCGYEPQDKQYYQQTYHDGFYDRTAAPPKSSRRSILLGKSSQAMPPPQSSETYTIYQR